MRLIFWVWSEKMTFVSFFVFKLSDLNFEGSLIIQLQVYSLHWYDFLPEIYYFTRPNLQTEMELGCKSFKVFYFFLSWFNFLRYWRITRQREGAGLFYFLWHFNLPTSIHTFTCSFIFRWILLFLIPAHGDVN